MKVTNTLHTGRVYVFVCVSGEWIENYNNTDDKIYLDFMLSWSTIMSDYKNKIPNIATGISSWIPSITLRPFLLRGTSIRRLAIRSKVFEKRFWKHQFCFIFHCCCCRRLYWLVHSTKNYTKQYAFCEWKKIHSFIHPTEKHLRKPNRFAWMMAHISSNGTDDSDNHFIAAVIRKYFHFKIYLRISNEIYPVINTD